MNDMLRLRSVTAGYRDTIVLREVDFRVGAGEVVALLGPNGAGKSTLLRTATGLLRPHSGRIDVAEEDVTGRRAHEFVRRGICHLPEGRGIFPSLSVRDNLLILGKGQNIDDAIAKARALFPVLGDRLGQTAGSLSGGEQQMLALSRAYLSGPKIVMIDEASLGLAPRMVDRIYDALSHLVETGISVVIVEQYVQKALQLAQTVCILAKGRILHVGPANQLSADEIYQRYLGTEDSGET